MKKIIFIIIFKILLLEVGYAQNQVITKMVIPEKVRNSFVKMVTTSAPYHAFPKTVYTAQRADNHLLFFNGQPVLKLNKAMKRSVLLLPELSFSDVLESSMNHIKADLVSTYDDHITGLFKDAPSLIKLKFILPM